MTNILNKYKSITNEKFERLKNNIYKILDEDDYVYDSLDKKLGKTNIMYFSNGPRKVISTFMQIQSEIIKKIAIKSNIKIKQNTSDHIRYLISCMIFNYHKLDSYTSYKNMFKNGNIPGEPYIIDQQEIHDNKICCNCGKNKGIMYIHVCENKDIIVLLGSSCILKYLNILIDVNERSNIDDYYKIEKCQKCIDKIKKHRKNAEDEMKIRKRKAENKMKIRKRKEQKRKKFQKEIIIGEEIICGTLDMSNQIIKTEDGELFICPKKIINCIKLKKPEKYKINPTNYFKKNRYIKVTFKRTENDEVEYTYSI